MYFLLFTYLGYSPGEMPSPGPQSAGLKVIEIIMWGLIIFLVLINGIQYFFQIDMKTAVKNLFKALHQKLIFKFNQKQIMMIKRK